MAELDPFGVPAGGPALGNGVAGEEDPAAAFLAQQESEIAGIENDEAFAILDGGAPGSQPHGEPPGIPDAVDGVTNGDYYQESNGPTDSYAAISQVDRLQSEPESIRKWREEQTERLEALDANSRKQEAEWKEKAIKELDEWYARQDEQLQKTKANNRVADEAFYKQPFADVIGYVYVAKLIPFLVLIPTFCLELMLLLCHKLLCFLNYFRLALWGLPKSW
uniref:Clathrin light chain n=1 Tax=Bos mutus grunniens TaxID=30521 RepID=A0A8B9WBX4_BOSMU